MKNAPSSVTSGEWGAFVERLYRQNEFAIKLGLEAIGDALEREGRPDRSHRIVLVGGTNGKGETAAFLSSILSAHGLSVGLYTSPHILDFRERFRVGGKLLDHEQVLRLGRHVLERYGEPGSTGPQLTFFELTTLMAVLGFREQPVDVGVYEVGLGGRLDATNALSAELSVVTSVGLDHQQYLGETFAEVAGEKAGIFRPERPAVIGRQAHAEAKETLRELAPQGAASYDEEFWAEDDGTFVLDGGGIEVAWRQELPPTRRWNAACALQAASRFLGERFDKKRARRGLERSCWPGRLDFRKLNEQDFLFDAAHNPDAAEVLFDFVAERGVEVGAIVFAAMKDKDLEGIVLPIPNDVPIFGATLVSERAASADRLRAVLADKNVVEVGPTGEALAGAQRLAGADSTVLVFGSIYLLGECFDALGVEADSLVTYTG